MAGDTPLDFESWAGYREVEWEDTTGRRGTYIARVYRRKPYSRPQQEQQRHDSTKKSKS